jgi:valyl-tRNA synthetase
MYNRFSTWVEGLKWDWCISRQRHFGVPIPVWISKREGEIGKVLLPSKDQLPVDPLVDLPAGYISDEVEPVKDVMDTWATSSVTPSLISRAVSSEFGHEDNIFARITPAQMRPQAHEIIRTWAFYTIVKSMHHHGNVPWNEICISGWCLAKDGSKMSKSKGNIIEPIRLLDESGVDAVRYWTGTSRLGNDTVLDPNTMKQGRKLVNKLWNATKLVMQSLETAPSDLLNKPHIGGIEYHNLYPIDQWMIGELSACIATATAFFEKYEYAQALRAIEHFFWGTFCDNYLELVKWRIHSEGVEKVSAQASLKFAMDKILRMFGPFIPYVTEVLYQNLREDGQEKSLHSFGSWPSQIMNVKRDDHYSVIVPEIMSAVRKLKSTMGVSIKKEIQHIKLQLLPGKLEKVSAEEKITPILRDLHETLNVGQFLFEPVSEKEEFFAETETFKVSV